MKSFQELVSDAQTRIQEILPEDLQAGLEREPTLLIDVREPGEWENGHLPGAVHIPRGLLEMQIHQAVLEAAASEQSARMVAMRNATDAANEIVDDLTLEYNKVRQESITSELLDIVGGAAVLAP